MVKITIKGLILGLIMFLFLQSFAWILPNKVFLDKDIARYIGANSQYESGSVEIGEEYLSKRTENTKTFKLSKNANRIVSSIGAVHYKLDYSNPTDVWRNIVTNIVNGKVSKAPYNLEINETDKSFNVTDKRTGKITTVKFNGIKETALSANEKLSSKPPLTKGNKVIWIEITKGVDLTIIARLDGVSFQRKIKNAGALTVATFEVIGESIEYRAYGATGEKIEVNTSKQGNIITESFKELPTVFPVIIDPIWLVSGSADDATRRITPDHWNLTHGDDMAGSHSTWSQYGSGMRYQNLNISSDYTINSTTLTFTASSTTSGTVVRTRISGEGVADAPAFADSSAAFDSRWANRTTARIDFDGMGEWVLDSTYVSPELKTITEEIIALPDWENGFAQVYFYEDYEDRSDHNAYAFRASHSWDADPSKAPVLTIDFTIPPLPDMPTNLTVNRIGIDTLFIEWEKGAGAEDTIIMVSPASFLDAFLFGFEVYRNSSENVTVSGFSLDYVEYSIIAFSENNQGISDYTGIKNGGEIMTSLGFLFGMIVLLIISMIWWKRGLLHILTLGYAIALGYMAAANGWDLVFIPVIVITGIISIILFIYAMTKGDWL